MALTGLEYAFVGIIVFAGGLVAGVTGFGYAVVATATLASLLDPRTAVVIVILPLIAANLSLVRELDRDGLRSCARRFWPFVAGAAVGTTVGMAFLSRLPAAPLSLALGLFTLGYVAVAQSRVVLPGERWLAGVCVDESRGKKGLFGAIAGAIFGGTNVGVQVVAYLESFDLDHSTFVGVVAMIFLGIGSVRVGMAWWLGLYESAQLVGVSALAAVPGLLGVRAGKRLRPRISPLQRDLSVYLLLTVIGARLLWAGLGGL